MYILKLTKKLFSKLKYSQRSFIGFIILEKIREKERNLYLEFRPRFSEECERRRVSRISKAPRVGRRVRDVY